MFPTDRPNSLDSYSRPRSSPVFSVKFRSWSYQRSRSCQRSLGEAAKVFLLLDCRHWIESLTYVVEIVISSVGGRRLMCGWGVPSRKWIDSRCSCWNCGRESHRRSRRRWSPRVVAKLICKFAFVVQKIDLRFVENCFFAAMDGAECKFDKSWTRWLASNHISQRHSEVHTSCGCLEIWRLLFLNLLEGYREAEAAAGGKGWVGVAHGSIRPPIEEEPVFELLPHADDEGWSDGVLFIS